MHNQKVVTQKSYVYPYQNSTIPYTVWLSSGGDKQVKTIVFLGTIQLEMSARWVAESCPPNTAVVQGPPHWFAKSDGSDTPKYMFEFTKHAFDSLLNHYSITKVHVIAESQAVPGVLEVFVQEKYAPYIKRMTLLQPLGLNALAYQGTDEQRIHIFKRRIAANFLHQLTALLLDKRLRYNHRLANRIVGVTLRDPKVQAQYNSGLLHDAIPNLKRMRALHKDIVVICGARDKLFPPAEIITTLTKHKIDIPVEIIKGVPHSPLATRYGQKLLAAALNRWFDSQLYMRV